MPWAAFAADHVKARLAASELEVYKETARRKYPDGGSAAVVPEDSPDQLGLIVVQVWDQFRGTIRAKGHRFHVAVFHLIAPDFNPIRRNSPAFPTLVRGSRKEIGPLSCKPDSVSPACVGLGCT